MTGEQSVVCLINNTTNTENRIAFVFFHTAHVLGILKFWRKKILVNKCVDLYV